MEMKLSIVSHVKGDGDILLAWFQYYLRLGVSSFHLIVHGSRDENRTLYSLLNRFPIVIEDEYRSQFDSLEKAKRINSLLARMTGQWILLVDSDEFVECPYRSIKSTVRMLRLAGRNALYAPMLQHICSDGSLDTPETIADPFQTMSLCSTDLYTRMGVNASISKFPLLYCFENTQLVEGGNHTCPAANQAASLLGVTHHFKFRRSVSERLTARIDSAHSWRHESVGFKGYLASHGDRLPTTGTFPYSRDELFRRGLLQRFSVRSVIQRFARTVRRIGRHDDALEPQE
jgi:hypothetical protein